MRKQPLVLALSAVLLAITATPTLGASENNMSNTRKAVALLESIESGDSAPVSYVNPTKYIQHNLAVADGLAGFGEFLQAIPEGSARAKVVRAFEDGEYVFTHTDYNIFGPKVGFDLFRFEDGLIVEHWDNLEEKSETPNPSGRTQLDGPTDALELESTDTNKALVESFVNTILVNGKFDQLADFIEGDNYLQHNRHIADGVSGLSAALEAMAKQGIKMVYTDLHKVLGQGNFVLTISEGSFADQPTSFYDLFRVDKGKIVEHWDVVETITPAEQQKNGNGKFGNL